MYGIQNSVNMTGSRIKNVGSGFGVYLSQGF